MESEAIVHWLRDKAARADGHDYRRMLREAAGKIVELETELRELRAEQRRLKTYELEV